MKEVVCFALGVILGVIVLTAIILLLEEGE
jgi:hypothetical protein